MKQFILCLFAAILLAAFARATPVAAQNAINIAEPSAGNGWTVADNVVTITADGSYTITGSSDRNRVVIAAGVTATITLQDCSIIGAVASPFELAVGSSGQTHVTLNLIGNNLLTSVARFGAGLQVNGAASLTITGNGTLTATGGEGAAGIGGGYTESATVGHPSGSIIITGGVITATGGVGAAGIGGAYRSTGINITITGGVVMARSQGGQGNAAAIGGGYQGNAGAINIFGGNVFAWSDSGQGIGCASVGNTSESIRISGGITATNAIGLSSEGANMPVNVSNGVILANTLNAASFGQATVWTNMPITEAFVRAMANNAATAIRFVADNTILLHDTIRYTENIYHHDTLYQHIVQYDTLWQDSAVRLVNPALPTDTLIDTFYLPYIVYQPVHDTLIVHDTFRHVTEHQLIVLLSTTATTDDSNSTGAPLVVHKEAHAIAGAGGILLEGLTPGKAYAIYTAAGKLVIRDTAPFTGAALLQSLPPGPYLLWHSGAWTKFTHN